MTTWWEFWRLLVRHWIRIHCAWKRGRNLELQGRDPASDGRHRPVRKMISFSKIRRTTLRILSSFHAHAVNKEDEVFHSTFRSVLESKSNCLTSENLNGPDNASTIQFHRQFDLGRLRYLWKVYLSLTRSCLLHPSGYD